MQRARDQRQGRLKFCSRILVKDSAGEVSELAVSFSGRRWYQPRYSVGSTLLCTSAWKLTHLSVGCWLPHSVKCGEIYWCFTHRERGGGGLPVLYTWGELRGDLLVPGGGLQASAGESALDIAKFLVCAPSCLHLAIVL